MFFQSQTFWEYYHGNLMGNLDELVLPIHKLKGDLGSKSKILGIRFKGVRVFGHSFLINSRSAKWEYPGKVDSKTSCK